MMHIEAVWPGGIAFRGEEQRLGPSGRVHLRSSEFFVQKSVLLKRAYRRFSGMMFVQCRWAVALLVTAMVIPTFALAIQSDFRGGDLAEAWKAPNSPMEGVNRVQSFALLDPGPGARRGYTELLSYVLPSPNQEEAGSCLYMSLTGIGEWWLARLNPNSHRVSDGDFDLSERYLMNLSGVDEASSPVANWKTDSIFLFAAESEGALRNRDYRFTKGWFVETEDSYVRATAGTPGAELGTQINWMDERSGVGRVERVKMPEFQRSVLFADPQSNQWNVGIAPDELVAKMKAALRQNKAPLHVLYNHYGYWHAVMVVGYDDQYVTKDCPFVSGFSPSLERQAAEHRANAQRAQNPSEKERLLGLSRKALATAKAARSSFERIGGCSGRGAFYVRDSLYEDPNGAVYDYDPSVPGMKSKYTRPLVMLEYEWITVLSNHVTQISVR